MNRWKWMIVALLGCWGMLAHAAPEIGPRPENRIYDPDHQISEAKRDEISRNLASIHQNAGIDMLVAVVSDVRGTEPQRLAKNFADQWGYHGGHALVLFVPGMGGGPWIEVGGMIRSEIPDPTLAQITQNAINRARMEISTDESILRAVESLGDDLRFFGGQAARGTAPTVITMQPQAPIRYRNPVIVGLLQLFRDWRELMIFGVIGVLVILFLVLGLFRSWRRFKLMTPKKFPSISWKPRFGAPHAAIVYTYSQKHKTRSSR
ncbi:TPM domain-containing protein [Luteolibacter pohnpeiensis]|uniref:TPM domain-containing protein n=1 Tax=Luteolibacter pohnpeiensis TaxID=454153 RepID=A0A934SA36_9BACT|nr:TPM domain-containing protein [Luteolibacter pohnpeiensis]MBK1882114.1 TPM domain-containing protein [Luteolibacter pohnpeiensis]